MADTPWKINILNPKKWRFGSDDFAFNKITWFLGDFCRSTLKFCSFRMIFREVPQKLEGAFKEAPGSHHFQPSTSFMVPTTRGENQLKEGGKSGELSIPGIVVISSGWLWLLSIKHTFAVFHIFLQALSQWILKLVVNVGWFNCSRQIFSKVTILFIGKLRSMVNHLHRRTNRWLRTKMEIENSSSPTPRFTGGKIQTPLKTYPKRSLNFKNTWKTQNLR